MLYSFKVANWLWYSSAVIQFAVANQQKFTVLMYVEILWTVVSTAVPKCAMQENVHLAS